MKINFLILILSLSTVAIAQKKTDEKWLTKLSICTANATDGDANSSAIIKECALKFISMYKNGTILPYTFTVYDLNKTDNKYFLYKKYVLRLEGLKLREINEFAINIPELEGLNLRSNELNETTVHTNAFELVRNLKYLDLSRNRFETIPDKLIRNLFSLEYLNMSFNQLKSFQFGFGFNQHFKFKTIDLSYNKNVSQIASADFNLLRGNMIDVFNVSNCNLIKVNSGTLAKFYHLRVFSIENNYYLNFENFKHLLHAWSQKMEYLNFNNLNLMFYSRYNRIDEVLSRFERTLKYLHMAGNNIIASENREFFESKIRNYKQLEVLNLNLNRNLFSTAAIGSLNLSMNVNLTDLYLSNTGLSSLERVVLSNSVKYVDLSSNQLDKLDSLRLDEYPFLQKLNLSSNLFQNLSNLTKSKRFCGNLTMIDISMNKNLELNSSDIKCLFANKLTKVYISGIKGIRCDSDLISFVRKLFKSQIDSLYNVKCTSVDIKMCGTNSTIGDIKASGYGKQC